MDGCLPKKELLRPDEVAEHFSVSKKTVYNWIYQGKLKGYKIGRIVRVKQKSVIEMQKNSEIRTHTRP